MFYGSEPVLRGKWVDYKEVLSSAEQRKDPSKFNHVMQLNAARLMDFEATRIFLAAQVIHPFGRAVMSRLFDENRKYFINNINHRFRELSQFLTRGLHNHACIAAKEAVIHASDDHRPIRSGQVMGASPAEVRSFMEVTTHSEINFLCVNNLRKFE